MSRVEVGGGFYPSKEVISVQLNYDELIIHLRRRKLGVDKRGFECRKE